MTNNVQSTTSLRNPLSHPDMHLMTYGIRDIVVVAQKLKKLGIPEIIGENIGDPVAKGQQIPQFIKAIIKETIENDTTFAYVDSKGVMEARELAVENAKEVWPNTSITVDDVLFSNGLGHAIDLLYSKKRRESRILCPAPGYPAHNSSESFYSGEPVITYRLNPKNGWQIDLDDLENKIKTNKRVTGITLVNPNNPTGAVSDSEILEKVVRLAEKYNLFLISDEVYHNIVYNNCKFIPLLAVARDRIPFIVMHGVSKDIPWPGGRSGWLEVYNRELSSEFASYIAGIEQSMRIQVCATALPQHVIPKIYRHPQYIDYIRSWSKELEASGNYIADVLNSSKGLYCNRAYGAFYLMPMFEQGVLNNRQTLPIENTKTKEYIEELTSNPNLPLDKRFAYYLLASTGICVVPATDFYAEDYGFRVTTLEKNADRRKDTYKRLKEAIEKYLTSAP
ncbi:MAG TPA: pyridoxal phosphate-dependent aminotransferase [bacterium (Candidatus Stahlbacteria)]|nr:pyridoxal phosphate-dependent aminotransferase [Candidatus Stahlbacteria bacterium]